MQHGFNVYRRLDNGEIVHVAGRRDAEAAEKLGLELNEMWPGDYGYQEAISEPARCVPVTSSSRKKGLTKPNVLRRSGKSTEGLVPGIRVHIE
jgi:hypothetical protein